MRRSQGWLVLIFLLAGGLYAHVSRAFFCGYDDFLEVHRAAFEDTQNPSRMLTTTHFGTSKYRPLNRLLIYLTYRLGGGDPLWFRLRNFGFHLLAVAMVYGIGSMLFASPGAALGAALLFAVSPLANQCIVASSWTITAAYALFLAGLFLFFRAWYGMRPMLLWGAFLCVWPGLFLYEPVLMFFPVVYGFLLLAWWGKGKRPPAAFLFQLTLVTVLAAGTFFAARAMIHVPPSHHIPLAPIAKNSVMYAGALLSPLDPILANEVFDLPLPSELHLNLATLLPVAAVALFAVLILAAILILSKTVRSRLARADWPVMLFLAGSIPVSLAPFLLFTDHASETYLYLPAALYALLLAGIIHTVAPGPRVAAVLIALLVVPFAAGTWLRNEDVASCGATAQRILAGLPLKDWKTGSWSPRFAVVPGEPQKTRYGIYEYLGISTIDVGDPAFSSLSCALQLATHNPRVNATIVPPAELEACAASQLCYWVHDDGEITPAGGLK